MACHTSPHLVRVDCSAAGEEQLAQTCAGTENNSICILAIVAKVVWWILCYLRLRS